MPKQLQRKLIHLTEFQKGQIIGLWQENVATREIARRLKRNESTIRHQIQKFKKTGNCSRKIGSGRPTKTNSRQNAMIVSTALNNRKFTAREITNKLKLKVSHQTVRNRLHAAKIKSHIAVKKPCISSTNLKKRLEWAKAHRNWTIEQWNSVLFSDETQVMLRQTCQRRVWRRKNERLKPDCMNPIVKHQKSIMLWGCFSSKGVGELHMIDGKLNGQKYKLILKNKMITSATAMFGEGEFKFQHDNSPIHTASVVKNYLRSQNIQLLKWPPQSPDVNPIENIWAEIKRRSKDRNPTNTDELFNIIQNEWNHLEPNYLNSLIQSMPTRCNEIIKNKGYPIKY